MSERDFQKCTLNILGSGQSVLVVAPTGLGKTRAALRTDLGDSGKNLNQHRRDNHEQSHRNRLSGKGLGG